VLDGPFDSLAELLDAVADQYGDLDAFVDGEDRLTFTGWRRKAAGLAGSLAERGIGRGDVVCLMLPSSIDYAIGYAAVLQLGGIVTGINARLGPTEVNGILERCRPRMVIGSGSARPRVPDSYDGLLLARDELPGCYAHPSPTTPTKVRPESAAVIVWTSGTTGAPKGAWFDHAGLAAGARVSGLLSAPFDRRIMSSPMAHAAFMTRAWDQLAHVMTSVLTPAKWSAAAMLDALVRERITVGQGVPTQWEKVLELPQFASADLSQLRIVGTGAARVPPQLVHRLREHLSCPVIVRYATTETPVITGTRPDDPPDVLERSVGRPQDGVRIRIVDEAGRSLPAGEVGRVAVRSPCQMRGYWDDPTQTTAALTEDGWFVSSDLGRLGADGNLVLAGRATEAYIRGGYNIHPLEIENALSAHPGVRSVAVVGVPAPVIGEIGVAFVVPIAGARPSAADLQAWCAGLVADYKTPDRIEFVDDLPLTSMMKVDKRRLLELATHAAR